MPKSNFNQFIDECEDFRTTNNTSIHKISFETKSSCNEEYENQTNQTNQTNQNCHSHGNNVKTLNNSISNSNSRGGSNSSFSSNIFLSKSSNKSRDRFDRFSTTNRMNTYTNATSVQTNIFKKADDNSQCFNPTTPSASSISMPNQDAGIEINNQTFPSLTLSVAAVTVATTANVVPKKFKNFKDAICAAATAPSPAPALSTTTTTTKQKQTRALPTAPPMVVKRDSEMYAKKMLAKAKKLALLYDDNDNDDDIGDDDNDVLDFGCNRNSKTAFINKNNYENDSD
jgi:hypothetical protein